MLFEQSEHEPDEYDPEAEFRDPNSDSITIPTVDTDPSDVPAEIRRTFWTVIVVLKIAIIASSVGILLLAFGYDTTTGASVLAIGIGCFSMAWRLIRSFQRTDTADDSAEERETKP